MNLDKHVAVYLEELKEYRQYREVTSDQLESDLRYAIQHAAADPDVRASNNDITRMFFASLYWAGEYEIVAGVVATYKGMPVIKKTNVRRAIARFFFWPWWLKTVRGWDLDEMNREQYSQRRSDRTKFLWSPREQENVYGFKRVTRCYNLIKLWWFGR